jgi:hypothetical protein
MRSGVEFSFCDFYDLPHRVDQSVGTRSARTPRCGNEDTAFAYFGFHGEGVLTVCAIGGIDAITDASSGSGCGCTRFDGTICANGQRRRNAANGDSDVTRRLRGMASVKCQCVCMLICLFVVLFAAA